MKIINGEVITLKFITGNSKCLRDLNTPVTKGSIRDRTENITIIEPAIARLVDFANNGIFAHRVCFVSNQFFVCEYTNAKMMSLVDSI